MSALKVFRGQLYKQSVMDILSTVIGYAQKLFKKNGNMFKMVVWDFKPYEDVDYEIKFH